MLGCLFVVTALLDATERRCGENVASPFARCAQHIARGFHRLSASAHSPGPGRYAPFRSHGRATASCWLASLRRCAGIAWPDTGGGRVVRPIRTIGGTPETLSPLVCGRRLLGLGTPLSIGSDLPRRTEGRGKRSSLARSECEAGWAYRKGDCDARRSSSRTRLLGQAGPTFLSPCDRRPKDAALNRRAAR